MQEVVPSPELAVAEIALERLLPFVDECVCLQLIGIRELWWAEFAGVGAFPGVHPEVPPQVRHLDELPVAMRAVIRLFPRVKSHVRLEVVIPGESFVAFPALERFLPSMSSFVILQYMFIPERAIASTAGEQLVLFSIFTIDVLTWAVTLGRGTARRRRQRRIRKCLHHVFDLRRLQLLLGLPSNRAARHVIVIIPLRRVYGSRRRRRRVREPVRRVHARPGGQGGVERQPSQHLSRKHRSREQIQGGQVSVTGVVRFYRVRSFRTPL